jgi:hypothetical protein
MKNFRRKKVDVGPDAPHHAFASGKPSTNGTIHTPLYSRFASAQNVSAPTPVISGPVSLATRVNTNTGVLGNGRHEIVSQNHGIQNLSPVSRPLNINKPLPTHEDSCPSSPPAPRLDSTLPEEDSEDVLLWDYGTVVSQLLSVGDSETSAKLSPPTAEVERQFTPDSSLYEKLSFARPSSSSSSSSSVSMHHSAAQMPETATAQPESRESGPLSGLRHITPPKPSSPDILKKKYTPNTPQFGKTSNTDPHAMQPNSAILPLSQPVRLIICLLFMNEGLWVKLLDIWVRVDILCPCIPRYIVMTLH